MWMGTVNRISDISQKNCWLKKNCQKDITESISSLLSMEFWIWKSDYGHVFCHN